MSNYHDIGNQPGYAIWRLYRDVRNWAPSAIEDFKKYFPDRVNDFDVFKEHLRTIEKDGKKLGMHVNFRAFRERYPEIDQIKLKNKVGHALAEMKYARAAVERRRKEIAQAAGNTGS